MKSNRDTLFCPMIFTASSDFFSRPLQNKDPLIQKSQLADARMIFGVGVIAKSGALGHWTWLRAFVLVLLFGKAFAIQEKLYHTPCRATWVSGHARARIDLHRAETRFDSFDSSRGILGQLEGEEERKALEQFLDSKTGWKKGSGLAH